MPATAGRVRMPANNRVHSSAALQTHGIWQSAIGYDPYAPDQKKPPPTASGNDRDTQASLSAPSADQQNAYDSFQGLLALARLTGSNADEARGACRKCGRVGHLPFQCRNFLVLKDEAALTAAAAAASNLASYPDGGNGSSHHKDRTHVKRHPEEASGRAVSDLSSEEDESSETNESGLSDSSEDSEMERAIAAKYGKNVLNSLCRKGKSIHRKDQSKHKRSHSKKSKRRRDSSSGGDSIASSEEDLKKAKRRSRSKRSRKDKSDSGSDEEESDSESEEDQRRKRRRRRHSHKHRKSRSKHISKHLDESSEEERAKRLKNKVSSRGHADRKHR